MRRAPVALPTLATAQFQRFFECGRATGACFLWRVVGSYAKQLALTQQLLDAALGGSVQLLVDSLV